MVLVGLVRDTSNPLATRFEIRSPNPKNNTYLICASAYMAMLDGIKAALGEEKTAKELEKSISKNYGEKDFYFETNKNFTGGQAQAIPSLAATYRSKPGMSVSAFRLQRNRQGNP